MENAFPKLITTEFIIKHPDINFVYGSNLLHKGNYGQSKVCRGHSNCYGIPTIRTLCSDAAICYMNDVMYDFYIGKIDQAIQKVPRDKLIYVLPKIGQGYSQLSTRAPLVYAYLMRRLAEEFHYAP